MTRDDLMAFKAQTGTELNLAAALLREMNALDGLVQLATEAANTIAFNHTMGEHPVNKLRKALARVAEMRGQ